VHQQSFDTSSESGNNQGSNGKSLSSSSEQVSKISGLTCFREILETEGISQREENLISGSRRAGSISSYKSAWAKWAGWCGGRQVNPIEAPLVYILDYLAMLF